MDIGNMVPEIVDAVHLMYEDYPDVELDCMLYLLKHTPLEQREQIDLWFDEHNRCNVCGSQLESTHYRVIHREFDPPEYETLFGYYCPVCDMGGEED